MIMTLVVDPVVTAAGTSPHARGEHGRPRSSSPTAELRALLQREVDLLPRLVPGCDHASITTVIDGRLTVRAATDATAWRAAALQDELDEGPSLQAVRTGHSVLTHDLRVESRWVTWCAAAVGDLRVTAALSVLLGPTLRSPATLDLCSDTVGGLDGLDIAQLHRLAAPLTAALGNAHADRWTSHGRPGE